MKYIKKKVEGNTFVNNLETKKKDQAETENPAV